MSDTNAPQADTLDQATKSDTQTPILETAQPTVPPADPVTTPAQEAESTINVTPNSESPSSINSARIIRTLLIIIVITVMVAVGYFLMARMSGSSVPQTNEAITPITIEATITPTPKNEQDEVDEINTTFPDSEMNSIQTDIQAL